MVLGVGYRVFVRIVGTWRAASELKSVLIC